MSKKRRTVRFYQDIAGGWRWQLRAGNGRIIDSGEGYTTRLSCAREFLLTTGYASLHDASADLRVRWEA